MRCSRADQARESKSSSSRFTTLQPILLLEFGTFIGPRLFNRASIVRLLLLRPLIRFKHTLSGSSFTNSMPGPIVSSGPMVLPKGSTLATVLKGHDDALAVAVTAEKGGQPLRLSRAQLRALVASLARRIAAAGVKPGDVVSIAMTNTLEFLIAFLAITQARAIAAPFNAAYKQVRECA